MEQFSAGSLRPTLLDERRRRPRRHSCDECRVSVLDGALMGQTFDCVFREISADSASLLVRAELRVGQRVRLQSYNEGVPTGSPIPAEVIRSRQLTTGRYDVVIDYRRPVEAPKPSESQRRHERRQAKLARVAPGEPTIRSL